MKRFIIRSTILVALVVVGLGIFTTPAQAQRRFASAQDYFQSFVPTQLQQSAFRQAAYNTAVIGRVYSRIPPYLFGYNPYPQAYNYGPVYPYQPYPYYPMSPVYSYPYSYPYASPYTNYVTPYNPYATPYVPAVVNPYGAY
jgi:hypothetical protein